LSVHYRNSDTSEHLLDALLSKNLVSVEPASLQPTYLKNAATVLNIDTAFDNDNGICSKEDE
jgi:hypothetical protein